NLATITCICLLVLICFLHPSICMLEIGHNQGDTEQKWDIEHNQEVHFIQNFFISAAIRIVLYKTLQQLHVFVYYIKQIAAASQTNSRAVASAFKKQCHNILFASTIQKFRKSV
ncbi:hypothetical protein ACJX0J_041360, partial [Zea mays]